MNTKLAAAIVILTAFAGTTVIAQDRTVPKASKADVQKFVDSMKDDKAKLKLFCAVMKLQKQYTAAEEKNDKKTMVALDRQLEQASKKIGPDFDKITSSEIDDESAALLEGLIKSCG